MNRNIKVADETWIAAALLHKENPAKESFAASEIVDRADEENIFGRLRPVVQIHAYLHCVANKRPNPGRYRMLSETPNAKRRLFKPGDPYHPYREGSKIKPLSADIPEKYHKLLLWYDEEYTQSGV